jgi:NitT/TauT family transport system permease protein
MSDSPEFKSAADTSSAIPPDTVVPKTSVAARPQRRGIFALRRPIPRWLSVLLGLVCLATVLGIWWFITRGEYEERIVQYATLPSPAETFAREQLHTLWYDNDLLSNLYVSLKRVVLGFALAAAVGIPVGVLCGCFPWMNSFLAPVNAFGRNVPIAALIPLTFAIFGIDELQKVMFIFLAVVAFVMMDTAASVADVSDRYIDTAYTLGASRWQIIRKVIVPLAMPRVFNSLRLLFGLAFGYIMLAELVSTGAGTGGVGNIINVSQRRSHRETIYLIVLIIPAVALVIDRLLFLAQRSLFPYQYGGNGLLHHGWRGLMHAAESVKRLFFAPSPLDAAQRAAMSPSGGKQTT